MSSQNSNEFEKDDGLDFFKTSKKNAPNQGKQTTPYPEIPTGKIKHDFSDALNKSVPFVKSKTKKIIIIASAIIVPIFIGSMLQHPPVSSPGVDKIKSNPSAILVPKNAEVAGSKDALNIDYSKVSKEDAENIKQILQVGKDIQQQLLESARASNPQKN